MSNKDSDEFESIIRNNNMENLIPEVDEISIRFMHEGVSDLAETIQYIMDFISALFASSMQEVPEQDRPALSHESIMAIKTTIKSSQEFNQLIAEEMFDQENEDDK